MISDMEINENLSRYSDLAFSTSLVLLVVALLMLTAELAGSRGRRAQARDNERELLEVGSSVGSGSPPIGTAVPGRIVTPEKRPLGESLGRSGMLLVGVGTLSLLASVVLRGLATNRFPWGNMYEFVNVTVLFALLAGLAMLRRPALRPMWVFVLIPALVLMTVSVVWLYSAAAPVVPALQSYWLPIHVSVVSLGSGVFLVAGVASLLFLLRLRFPGSGSDSSHWFVRMLGNLPDARTLDSIAYKATIFGFPIFGFGVVFGAIWAEAAWGRFWGWDPKETVSFIAWVVYAAYLHARATSGWRDTRAAWINVVGFLVTVFNLFFINMVVSGLHSYAGLN